MGDVHVDSKKLTGARVRDAKPSDKDFMLRDGEGLFLQVATTGEKWWRYRYTLHGKARKSGLGPYPKITLATARKLRDEKRDLIVAGVDPVEQKRSAKNARAAARSAQNDTFEQVARAWHTSRADSGWSPSYAKKTLENLERNAFAAIGKKPISEIARADIKELFQRERPGRAGKMTKPPLGEAHKLRQIMDSVFQYAGLAELTDANPAHALKGFLAKKKGVSHYSTITDPARVGELLRAIDGYVGSAAVLSALRMAPYVFVRPTELRHAQWSQFALTGDHPEWRIHGSSMKSGVEHRVPLAPQVVAILRELQPLTGHGALLFPGQRSPDRPISDSTINAALRTLGYSGDLITGHGFRGMASTLLNEQGWNPDAIERQLAHCERNKVRAAYNHARMIPERRKMMQAWADYLDGLRAHASHAPKPRF
jgi:integrase